MADPRRLPSGGNSGSCSDDDADDGGAPAFLLHVPDSSASPAALRLDTTRSPPASFRLMVPGSPSTADPSRLVIPDVAVAAPTPTVSRSNSPTGPSSRGSSPSRTTSPTTGAAPGISHHHNPHPHPHLHYAPALAAQPIAEQDENDEDADIVAAPAPRAPVAAQYVMPTAVRKSSIRSRLTTRFPNGLLPVDARSFAGLTPLDGAVDARSLALTMATGRSGFSRSMMTAANHFLNHEALTELPDVDLEYNELVAAAPLGADLLDVEAARTVVTFREAVDAMIADQQVLGAHTGMLDTGAADGMDPPLTPSRAALITSMEKLDPNAAGNDLGPATPLLPEPMSADPKSAPTSLLEFPASMPLLKSAAWTLVDMWNNLTDRIMGDHIDHTRAVLSLQPVPAVVDEVPDSSATIVDGGSNGSITDPVERSGSTEPLVEKGADSVIEKEESSTSRIALLFKRKPMRNPRPAVIVQDWVLTGRSLWLFPPTARIRHACVQMVQHRAQKTIATVCIFAHWCAMALRSWEPGESDTFTLFTSPHEIFWVPLFVLLTLEMLAKIIAFGAILPDPLPTRATLASRTVPDGLLDPATPVLTDPRRGDRPVFSLAPMDDYRAAVAAERGGVRCLQRPVLHTPMHVLDFISVLGFWLYLLGGTLNLWPTTGGSLWIFRGMAALRVFRLLSLTPGTSVIVKTLAVSRSMLLNVFYFVGYFFLIGAITGVLTFKGTFHRHCMVPHPDGSLVGITPTQYCGGYEHPFLDGVQLTPLGSNAVDTKGYICPRPQVCVANQPNPHAGFASFDSIWSSLLVVFTIVSLENWSEFLYGTQDGEMSEGAALFFVLLIIVLGFLLIQLFAAVITETFVLVHAEFKEARRKAQLAAQRREHLAKQAAAANNKKPVVAPQAQEPIKRQGFGKHIGLTFNSVVADSGGNGRDGSRHGSTFAPSRRGSTLPRRQPSMSSMTPSSALTPPSAAGIPHGLPPAPPSRWRVWTDKVRRKEIKTMWAWKVVFLGMNSVYLAVRGMDAVKWGPNLSLPAFEVVYTLFFALDLGLSRLKWPSWRSFFVRHPVDTSLLLITVPLLFVPFNKYLTGFQLARTNKLVTSSALRKLFKGTDQFFGVATVALFMLMTLLAVSTFLMQLLGGKYVSETNPWLHYDTFPGALLSTFVLLTGDNWTEQLWSSMAARPDDAVAYVVIAVVTLAVFSMYTFVVVNLFVFVVLDEYELSEEEKRVHQVRNYEDPTAWNPFKAAVKKIKQAAREIWLDLTVFGRRLVALVMRQSDKDALAKSAMNPPSKSRPRPRRNSDATYPRVAAEDDDDDDDSQAEWWKYVESAADSQKSFSVRKMLQQMVRSWQFKTLVLIAIIGSIVIAALDTPVHRLLLQREKPDDAERQERMFFILDAATLIVFLLEFIAKISAHGPRRYFKKPWNWLDFIVVVSMATYLIGTLVGFKDTVGVLRLMRSLRPLRIISYFTKVRSIFTTLIYGLPRIVEASTFALLVMVPFAVYGVYLFQGALYTCNDTSVTTRDECVGMYLQPGVLGQATVLAPRVWANPREDYNWDSLTDAMLTLFIMASREGWSSFMAQAQAIVGLGMQPASSPATAPAASWWNMFFFVAYALVGSLFTLNLFIGVIARALDEMSGQAYLTAPQKSWIQLQRRILALRPRLARKRGKLGMWCKNVLKYRDGLWRKAIKAIMAGHMVVICSEYYGEPEWLDATKENVFLITTVIYAADLALRVGSVGPHGFFRRSYWNWFDALVTTSALSVMVVQLFVDNPLLGRIQKLVLIGYALRIARKLRQLSTLFKTIGASLKETGQILCVLLIVLAFYSLVFTEVLGLVRYGTSFSADANFRTFPLSLLLLFRLLTGDDWPSVMADGRNSYPACVVDGPSDLNTDCGKRYWAYILPVSYLVVSGYILLNLVIASLMQHFDTLFSDNTYQRVSDTDLKALRKAWKRLDPRGVGTIKASQIPALLRHLPPPFEFQLYPDPHLHVPNLKSKVRALVQEMGAIQAVATVQEEIAVTKVDLRARRNIFNIVYHDLRARCRADKLHFHDALIVLCLHVIPIQEYLTFDEYMQRIHDLQVVNRTIARSRITGLFRTAMERWRFRKVVQEVMARRRLEMGQEQTAGDGSGATTAAQSVDDTLTRSVDPQAAVTDVVTRTIDEPVIISVTPESPPRSIDDHEPVIISVTPDSPPRPLNDPTPVVAEEALGVPVRTIDEPPMTFTVTPSSPRPSMDAPMTFVVTPDSPTRAADGAADVAFIATPDTPLRSAPPASSSVNE
ncbi:calcium channel protein [Allomyces arbusculus]|nr:calcium channel protein [Allomyces arbusculus]